MRRTLCCVILSLACAASAAHAGIPAPVASGGKAGTVAVAAASITYYAQAGDTLMSIAQQFTGKSGNWASLGKINHIEKDIRIPIGTGIVIPADLLLDAPVEAKIIAMSGTITAKGADGRTAALSVGARVSEGMEIDTSENGFVTIGLPDSTRISIPSVSRVKLSKLRLTMYTKSPRTEVTLLRGRVESRVAPLEETKGKFEVRTPQSVAGVRGTHFRVGLAGDGIANEVIDGKVAVEPHSRPLSPSASGENPAGTVLIGSAKGSIVSRHQSGPVVDLLPAPQIAAPAGNSYTTPQFTLHPVDGAASYHVQVSKDRDALDMIAESRSPTTTVKINGMRNGEYFMHASAVDKSGLEGLVRTQPFSLHAQANTRPAPSASGTPYVDTSDSKTITLRWPAQPGKQYNVQVARDADFSWLIHNSRVTAPEATLPRPAFGTYYARVQTINADGSSNGFSPVQPFVVTDHWVLNDNSQAKVNNPQSGQGR